MIWASTSGAMVPAPGLKGMAQPGNDVEIAPHRHLAQDFPQEVHPAKGVPGALDEQGRAGQLIEGLIPQLLRLARGVQGISQEDQAAGPHVLGHDLGGQAGPHGFAAQVESPGP